MGERARALFRALVIGVQIASATAWKRRLITGGMVASFLGACLAIARSFGWDVALTDEQLARLGELVVVVGGLLVSLLTAATNADVGLRPKPGAGDGGGVGEEPPALPTPDDSRFESIEAGGSAPPIVSGPVVPDHWPGRGNQPVDPFRDHGA